MAKERCREGGRGSGVGELRVGEVGNGGDCRDERGVSYDEVEVRAAGGARIPAEDSKRTAY